jgi:hypothetical protein
LPLKLCGVPAVAELDVVDELAEEVVGGGAPFGIIPPEI